MLLGRVGDRCGAAAPETPLVCSFCATRLPRDFQLHHGRAIGCASLAAPPPHPAPRSGARRDHEPHGRERAGHATIGAAHAARLEHDLGL